MKKLAIIAALLVASATSYAQGTINFNNRVSGTVDAPVFDVGGTVRLDGAAYLAQVYAGPAGAADSALTAQGAAVAFRTGAAAGYVQSPGEIAINGVAAGARAQIQLRAWAAAGGGSYEAATAAGAKAGASTSFLSEPLGGIIPNQPPATSPFMTGLTSFSLVPEPSTIALGALGAMALLFRRRK
jgi:hypothetical protein